MVAKCYNKFIILPTPPRLTSLFTLYDAMRGGGYFIGVDVFVRYKSNNAVRRCDVVVDADAIVRRCDDLML